MSDIPTQAVTLLFTDIEGSTGLLQRVGDRYAGLLDEHRSLLRSVFERHGGHEFGAEGDALFVSFAQAHAAVAAAADAQRELAAHVWPPDAEIRVRIGLHTGEPRLVGSDYVGLDVHRVARVTAAAHGGQVLVSASTRSELDGETQLLDLGEHRLKDLLQPERLYQLVIPGLPTEFPPLRTLGTRPTNLPGQPNLLIGRERELEAVRTLVSGVDRLVTLTGPGGSGKTRLALQLGADVLDEFASGVFFVSLATVDHWRSSSPPLASRSCRPRRCSVASTDA
jgi:class 3 adenylate cyclase